MTKVLTDPKYYTAIANAIRAKNGSTAIYKPSGMAAAISAIQVGGGSAAMYPKVRIKQTENQVIQVTPKLRTDIYNSISSTDTDLDGDGYVDFDWYLSRGTPIQFAVTVATSSIYDAPGNLIVNGENIGSTTATLDIDKDLTIEAEDAQLISSFMPESYAVLYFISATVGTVLRVVSPSLPGGEEVGTAVPNQGGSSLLCNVTDTAFNVINGLKVFSLNIDLGSIQETTITPQKGTPVSADVSGFPVYFFAASINEAKAIAASLG